MSQPYVTPARRLDESGMWVLRKYHETEIKRLREALKLVTEALDDAIVHNVNATSYDSAGLTQEDYDSWYAALTKGLQALGEPDE